MQKNARSLIILGLIAIAGTAYGFSSKSPEEIIAESIRKSNIEINIRNTATVEAYKQSIAICTTTQTGSNTEVLQKLSTCLNKPKPKLEELISVGDSNSGKILVKAIGNTNKTEKIKVSPDSESIAELLTRVDLNLTELHTQLCKKQINSPICKDRALFDRLYRITEERIPGKQFFPILLGMTNSESSLGLDMAKDRVGGLCHGRNNWGGAKYQIKDDNTREYKRELNGFSYKYPIDQFGCNLYPFETIEEYWTSKVNGIRYGYKGCIDSKTPIACISIYYVGSVKVVKPQWVRNASVFLN